MSRYNGEKMNRSQRIIAEIFAKHFQPGVTEIEFTRQEIEEVSRNLGITLPKKPWRYPL
jgi:hypothetical protein